MGGGSRKRPAPLPNARRGPRGRFAPPRATRVNLRSGGSSKIPIIGLVEAPGDVGAYRKAMLTLNPAMPLAHGPTSGEEMETVEVNWYPKADPGGPSSPPWEGRWPRVSARGRPRPFCAGPQFGQSSPPREIISDSYTGL